MTYDETAFTYVHDSCRDEAASITNPTEIRCTKCFRTAVLLIDGEVDELLPC